MKKNCWEFMSCGRELRGKNVKEFGVCPAATDARLDGLHGGNNAGRACWMVAGTFCGGEVQGTFAKKYGSCVECDFYKQVHREENSNYTGSFWFMNKIESTK